MSIEAMKQALEALEAAKNNHGVMLLSDPPREAWRFHRVDDAVSASITALRQAIEQAEQKTAVSLDGGKGFIDGVWHCQCGKSYEVTCISSKPKGKSWKSWA